MQMVDDERSAKMNENERIGEDLEIASPSDLEVILWETSNCLALSTACCDWFKV
jgi:hypothetical protein